MLSQAGVDEDPLLGQELTYLAFLMTEHISEHTWTGP